MKIIFLTIGKIKNIEDHGIYSDLLRYFRDKGHDVCIVCQNERREGEKTHLETSNNVRILYVRTGNITKTNILEKGISTLLIGSEYEQAINKYFKNESFDIILYSTPPITLAPIVSYMKWRDDAFTYLMLKDIFPQNAVDLGMMKKVGLSGILYKYFRRKEHQLYSCSDMIGCMSSANIEYILKHNPEISPKKVELCPNSIEVRDLSLTSEEKVGMRKKYGLPTDKIIFVYGGNLGRPQGISFLIECLKSQADNPNVFFLIVGSGTEYGKLEEFFNRDSPSNMKLMKSLPKEDYDRMISTCDVGMLFLDHRFTIPNFPSRLLSYMQAKLPVLACTDPYTDIGKIIVNGRFGWWCESDDVENFNRIVEQIKKVNLTSMGDNAQQYLKQNYTVKKTYEIIMRKMKESA